MFSWEDNLFYLFSNRYFANSPLEGSPTFQVGRGVLKNTLRLVSLDTSLKGGVLV